MHTQAKILVFFKLALALCLLVSFDALSCVTEGEDVGEYTLQEVIDHTHKEKKSAYLNEISSRTLDKHEAKDSHEKCKCCYLCVCVVCGSCTGCSATALTCDVVKNKSFEILRDDLASKRNGYVSHPKVPLEHPPKQALSLH